MPLSKWASGTVLTLQQPRRAARTFTYLQQLSTSCAQRKTFLTSKHTRQQTFRCHASESQDTAEDASNREPCGILPLFVQADATRRRTDRLAAILVVVALFFWGCRWHSQIARWLSIHLHKLDMLVCLGVLTTMASVALYCQGRFALFWGRQQRRLACIDVIPALASDVGILKQDVADIKQDVVEIKKDITDIKDMLAARPWFRF